MSAPATSGGTMLARLDRETRSLHADADRVWLDVLDARSRYEHALVTTYGFEAPYESACAYTPGLALAVNLRGRWRAGLIAQDLLSLGWTPDHVTAMKCLVLSPFQDAAEALGWMYVVERITLLHAQIRTQLVGRFVDLARAVTYLSAYQTTTSARWSELGVGLERVSMSDRVADRIARAARAGFERLLEWQHTSGAHLRIVG